MEDILVSEEYDDPCRREYFLHSTKPISLIRNSVVFLVPLNYLDSTIHTMLEQLGDNGRVLVERVACISSVVSIKVTHRSLYVTVKSIVDWENVERQIVNSFKHALNADLQYFRARK